MKETDDDMSALLGVVHPEDTPMRSRVLQEAMDLVEGDRQKEYGTPSESLQRIADFWSLMFPEREWTAGDVALALLGLKLSRAVNGYKLDSAVDLAGYAALWAEVNE